MHILRILSLLFGLYFSQNIYALASINLDNSVSEFNISSYISYAISKSEVANENFKNFDYIENNSSALKLGYKSQYIILKFKVKSSEVINKNFYLNFDSINGKIKLFKIINGKLNLIGINGTDIPIHQRPLKDSHGAIDLKLGDSLENEYLVEYSSRHNINIKLLLSDEKSISQADEKQTNFLNFYVGGILFLIFYNFFIFLMLKDKVYLYYCFYAFSFMITSLIVKGQLDIYIPMNSFTFAHYLICASSMALFSATLFTKKFLRINSLLSHFSKFYHFFLIISFSIFLVGLTNFANLYPNVMGMMIDIAISLGLIMFVVSSLKLYKIFPIARYYLLSWGIVLFSVLSWFGMKFGLLPINTFFQNALPLGSMLEMLTLSLALAYQIVILNHEKKLALLKAKDKDKYVRLVRVLSHDVANSLSVVLGYSKKALKSDQLNPSLKSNLEKIMFGAENIKNILQIVREQEIASNETSAFKLENVNLSEAINYSLTLYEEEILRKKIAIKLSISDKIMIKADKTCFINNIINNILSNAIKFSFEESELEIIGSEIDSQTFVQFIDHGVGIKNDLVNDIFHSNKIISSLGTKNEIGHGLGSNLLREYVHLFEGKIQVKSLHISESEQDHGTQIKLIFPRQTSL